MHLHEYFVPSLISVLLFSLFLDPGQPKRHLLTTGWSLFVSGKRLFAGDSVLFIRYEWQVLFGMLVYLKLYMYGFQHGFKMWPIYDERALLETFLSWPNCIFAAIWNSISA